MEFPEVSTVLGFYIPRKEISFRLLSYSSKHVLFSRAYEDDPDFGHFEGPTYDDQWFSLIRGTGKFAGCYAIKSKFTDKVIFSRTHTEPRVGHVDGDGKYEDNWFRFEPGTGKFADHFRIRNFGSDQVIVSRTHLEPHLTNFPGTETIRDDHYFSFVFEDTEFDRIEYMLPRGKILSSIPEVIGTSSQRNDTSESQRMQFDFSKAQTSSSSFKYGYGFKATTGEPSGKVAGIPVVAEGQLRVDLSTSYDFK